jgi:hypothetical protein
MLMGCCSKYWHQNAEVWGVDLSLIQPRQYVLRFQQYLQNLTHLAESRPTLPSNNEISNHPGMAWSWILGI